MISAKVIAHSISHKDSQLLTFQVRFPYIILNQVRTYGMLSYSVRSMRAVPTSKLIDEVANFPFVPREWRERKRGMVAGDLLTQGEQDEANAAWQKARVAAITAASTLAAVGAAKEHTNRLLTPFAWADAVITGTAEELRWMIEQRMQDDAQREFQELALAMTKEWTQSTPVKISRGGWHLPYITDDDRAEWGIDIGLLREISAARCARVSYTPFDSNKRDIKADFDVVAKLLGSTPHLSPFEHQAMSTDSLRHHGKLFGWIPNRLMMGY